MVEININKVNHIIEVKNNIIKSKIYCKFSENISIA